MVVSSKIDTIIRVQHREIIIRTDSIVTQKCSGQLPVASITRQMQPQTVVKSTDVIAPNIGSSKFTEVITKCVGNVCGWHLSVYVDGLLTH